MGSCKKCTKQTSRSRKGVNCANCKDLYHASCGIISDALLKEIEQGNTDWRCSSCRNSDKRRSFINVGGSRTPSVSSANIGDENEIYDNTNISSTLTDLAAEINQVQLVQETCLKSMKSISEKMNELQTLSKKVDNHESRIKLLEKENASLKTAVKSLTVRMDNGEQRCNANKIQINCVPITPSENLRKIVTEIGQKLNVNIADNDIAEIIRIKNKINKPGSNTADVPVAGGSSMASNSDTTSTSGSNNNPIIVNFKSSEKSKQVIESFRGNKSVLFLDTDNKIKIYINEFLTSNRKRLLYRAKLFGKSNGYKYIWTKGGNIYMRKSDGERIIRIDSGTDFASIGDEGAGSMETG